MRLIPFIFLLIMAASCTSTSLLSKDEAGMEDGWYVHLDTAKSEARKADRPMFLLFTGSDWCAPCMRLEKEVLSQKEFQEFAKKNLVLVKMDFPKKKPQPSIEMQVHRDTVVTRYLGDRQSVPTIFLLNEDGSLIAKTTFRAGGADAYVRHIRQLLGM